MARYRTIKPTIWTDEKILTLEIPARYLFIGLFSNADDEGYITANAASLNATIFGGQCELEKVRQWLQQIESLRMIIPEAIDPDDHVGGRYYRLPRFLDHQKINRPLRSPIGDRLRTRGPREEGDDPLSNSRNAVTEGGVQGASNPKGTSDPPTPAPPSTKKESRSQRMYREDVECVMAAFSGRFKDHTITHAQAGLLIKAAYEADIDPRYVIFRVKQSHADPFRCFLHMLSRKNSNRLVLPGQMKPTHGFDAFGKRPRAATKDKPVRLGAYLKHIQEQTDEMQ